MTAIAYRGGILAADTQQIAGRIREGFSAKIMRRADGAMAGASGRADICWQFLEDFGRGGDPGSFRPTVKDDEDFSGLWITHDGVVWDCTPQGAYPAGDCPWNVLGSAYAFLHGAMAAGASAEQAVRLAIEHCADCGGEVTVLRLDYVNGAEKDDRIDPAEWPVHERLKALIRTTEPITYDYMSSHKIERTTSWGSNLHLQTRKKEMGKATEPSNLLEIPSLIGQTWGTNGVEETERVIDEGNAMNSLMLPTWRPGSIGGQRGNSLDAR